MIETMSKLAAQDIPGLVWLAGYPRSGVTLLRTILARCFAMQTASLYAERQLGDSYVDTLNHVNVVGLGFADIATIAAGGGLAVKTHEIPPSNMTGRVIVIVRDGRSVMASLQAFYRDLCGTQVTMRELIEGRHRWGSWSAWIKAWRGYDGDVVWLRYGDILADVPRVLRRLAGWLGRTPRAWALPPFAELKAAHPQLWRRGQANADDALNGEDEARFWQVHGETMSHLGFTRGKEAA